MYKVQRFKICTSNTLKKAALPAVVGNHVQREESQKAGDDSSGLLTSLNRLGRSGLNFYCHGFR